MGIMATHHRPAGLILVTGADHGRSTERDVPATGVRRPPAATGTDGGLDAFLASVERKAYHIGYHALRDEQAALDVVQDSMLKLFEKYAQRPSHEWPALFSTILHHSITDTYRWKQLREAGGKDYRRRGRGGGPGVGHRGAGGGGQKPATPGPATHMERARPQRARFPGTSLRTLAYLPAVGSPALARPGTAINGDGCGTTGAAAATTAHLPAAPAATSANVVPAVQAGTWVSPAALFSR